MNALRWSRWVVPLALLCGCRTTANFDPVCPAEPGSGQGLSGTDLRNSSASNVVDALRGRVPGLIVRSVRGQPFLEIRGTSSMNSIEPLVVVDGVQMARRGAGGLSGLNVRDVANVHVLKSAGDLAMYGSEGGAGVLVVYTRRSGCD